MRNLLAPLTLAASLAGCALAWDAGRGHAQDTGPRPTEEPAEMAMAGLDGLVVPGRIRARGLIGLASVKGTLSFRDGMLVWAAQGQEESGPYQLAGQDGAYGFTAGYEIDNGEQVRWSGSFDGEAVSAVTAVWTRADGDLVHDLLLPRRVTLDFTPDQ